MKKIAFITLLLISLNSFSQAKSNKVTLKSIVDKMISQAESLKNIKEFKVLVDDTFVENTEAYMIDPKTIESLGIIKPGAVDRNEKKTIIVVMIKKSKKASRF